jgi:outer membrane protein insertion porin family
LRNSRTARPRPLLPGLPAFLLLTVSALAQPGPGPDPRGQLPVTRAAPSSGPLIISIEAKTQHAESLLVIQSSGLHTGDALTRDNLQQAIRRIFATGLFTAISADTTLIGDGVKLVFVVTEAPRLKAVHFLGNHKVATRDLNAKLAAKEGEVLSERRLFEWTQKVSDLYKEKGFVLAKVAAQKMPPDPQGRIEVNYTIDEGDRIRIRKVTFSGNQAIGSAALARKMVNKSYVFPWRSGNFKDDEFKKDMDRLADFYKERGYLNAKVLDYNLAYDKGWADISVRLSEGIKFYQGSLAFVGESLFTEKDLRKALHTSSGAVYNQKKVQQSLTDLYALYSEQGYIYAQVQPVDSIHGDTVDLRFTIAESRPARVRLVNVEGNDRTMEKVIRREVVSMPGGVFKRSEVIRSQQNIFNLGFFEDVQLDYKKVNDSSSDIDLTYKVKEKFPGTIGAGVTYSATEGLVGYVELTQPNLFGRAQNLHVKFEKGASKQNFELGFAEPWLFDTPTSVGANLFYTTVTYDYYDKRDRGGELNLSRVLPLDFTRGYFTFHAGDATISNVSSGYVPNPLYPLHTDTAQMTVSTTFRFDRDSRDYIFNPASGSFTSYAVKLAGGPLGGDVRFHKHTLESNFYYPLFWKFVLRFRSRFGYVSGYRFGSGDAANAYVPVYERFVPGGTGDDGVRGYSDRSLGVVQGGYNSGGRAEAIFSLEYRCRINRSLVALAFFDAGNAWESLRDVNLADLKRGAGAGIRMEIPMLGWLGFDLGYGFDRAGGGKFEPHFQLGAGFPINF